MLEKVKSNLSIVIPTHNRHNYLVRSVSWFLQWGYSIVVADSSQTEWKHRLLEDPKVTYIYMPGSGEVYINKLVAALRAVCTPMVALCADDDFILPSGLSVCEEFLEDHPEYAFCQGYAYMFQPIGRRLAIWPLPYDYHDIESPDWLQRVIARKSTVYYGLNRKSVLLEAFEFLDIKKISRSPQAGGLVDFTVTSIVARNGKMKRMKVPFSLREYSPVVSVVGTRSKLLLDHRLGAFYQALLLKLMRESNGDRAEVESGLLGAFSEDLAGQLHYDLTRSISKRDMVRALPKMVQEAAEFGLRCKTAINGFTRTGYFAALSIFKSKEYQLFKKHLKNFSV